MEAEPTAAGEMGFFDPVVPVSSYRDYMSEQSPAVFISHPPEALLRLVNPAMRFLLGTPLAGAARKQMMVVSFKGRKTGRPIVAPSPMASSGPSAPAG
jgi:hypothetical protein